MADLRDVAYRSADIAAVQAIAQAAINVELFTNPLYMTTMCSIQGMHPITGKGSDLYADRLWPGAVTAANPTTANERAFNIMFSVFIEEMLHLQLASNIASALGVTPVFTSAALQDSRHGWICYGPTQTIIPHIIDLRDTTHAGIPVSLRALDAQQIELFQAIEESAPTARRNINPMMLGKYFPTVPFVGWSSTKTETDLPLFGTVDHLYACYYDYLTLRYVDGTQLFDHVYTADSVQKDMWNEESAGHPVREYGFRTTCNARSFAGALAQILTMMNAITDQGEGSLLSVRLDDPARADEVAAAYEASADALEADYPDYTDTGAPAPSRDAAARADNGGLDHYARFGQLRELLPELVIWPDWLASHGPWTAADLSTGTLTSNPYGLPDPADVADAYNRLAAPGARGAAHQLISRAATGALANLTTTLDRYWSQPDVVFPYPAMVGSADRLTSCWALFGQPPDLAAGAESLDVGVLSHACQALDLSVPGNGCAPVANYNTCRGANLCAARGGCGFVQIASTPGPGAQCGSVLIKTKTTGVSDDLYSAPSNNRCATLGGCAVPISATQALPQDGTMQLVDFGRNGTPEVFGTMTFARGELVHDVAYRAYLAVMARRETPAPPTAPPASDIRLVFPPST